MRCPGTTANYSGWGSRRRRSSDEFPRHPHHDTVRILSTSGARRAPPSRPIRLPRLSQLLDPRSTKRRLREMRIGEHPGGVNSAPRRRTLALMVARRALLHKFAIYRVILIGAEIVTLNAQQHDRGANGALTVYVNLHAESDAEPA